MTTFFKKTEKTVETYHVSKNFFVDVEKTVSFGNDMYEFYLYHKDCGIKDFMIGLYVEDVESIWLTVENYLLEAVVNEIFRYYENYIRPCFTNEEIAKEEFDKYIEQRRKC